MGMAVILSQDVNIETFTRCAGIHRDANDEIKMHFPRRLAASLRALLPLSLALSGRKD